MLELNKIYNENFLESTLFAAMELKRNYIGFEIDDEYCEIAKNRLCQPAETPEKP